MILLTCEYCQSSKIIKHGRSSSGKTRYRCMDCNKTFSSSVQSVTYRRRLMTDEVALEFANLQREGIKLSIIAREFGISIKTAQNWDNTLKLRFPKGEVLE